MVFIIGMLVGAGLFVAGIFGKAVVDWLIAKAKAIKLP
jgi:hypothetical protein